MITFENVTYSYPCGRKVLNDITFTVDKGEKVGLIGSNGAGKSTLFKTALGLVKSQGRIVVDGLEMNKENLAAIRKKVGFVLQDSDNQMFMPTVFEDMIFGPMNYGMSKEAAKEQAEDTLKELGMEYLKERENHKISGGEKRMAAIATILAMKPDVMLMDEPSSALDPKNRRRVINLLNDLDVTMIIASHDLDMVLETCTRVVFIDDGIIVADGDAGEILRDKELLENHSLELPFCLQGVR